VFPQRLNSSIFASLVACGLIFSSPSSAETITWQGHQWNLRSATRSGPGPNNWNPKNVFVDTNGGLHLLISASPTSPNGFDCAELWTTEKLGFGTYQWQIETRLDNFDPWVVLGLFPYGPPALGPDGSNEIDIEFAKWGHPQGENVGFTIYPDSGKTIGHRGFRFSSKTARTTSRFTWNEKGIQFWLMEGFQPIDVTANVLETWDYAPTNSPVAIPQRPMPLHVNLWLNKGHAPADGRPVEVVIRAFSFR
jgi:hypothetical protein